VSSDFSCQPGALSRFCSQVYSSLRFLNVYLLTLLRREIPGYNSLRRAGAFYRLGRLFICKSPNPQVR
jgi:hypothetical protein